jgi:hypothetical protein
MPKRKREKDSVSNNPMAALSSAATYAAALPLFHELLAAADTSRAESKEGTRRQKAAKGAMEAAFAIMFRKPGGTSISHRTSRSTTQY